MSSDWRDAVLVQMARLLAAIALLPVLVGVFADPKGFLPFLPLAVGLVAAAIWAGWGRSLSVAARSWLMSLPLVLIGSISAYRLGPNVGVGLILAMATIVIGLVRGAVAGLAALVLTAACLLVFGYAGHVLWSAYVLAHQDQALYWVRSVIMYVGSTGIILLFVTRTVRRLDTTLDDHEVAEAQLRAQDEKLRLALEAAAVGTWSLDVDTRLFTWDRGAPLAAPPDTVAELLERVPADDRGRVMAALEDALSGRTEELRVEHLLISPDGGEAHVELRGRRHGAGAIVGTLVDVTERRHRDERRVAAQAALLRLSTSEAASRGDLEAAVREITATGVHLLGVERCSVWFLRAGDDTLECLDQFNRTSGRHERGELLRADAYPTYFAALRRQRTVAAHDARNDERTRELHAYLAHHGIAAMLDSPIHAGGCLAGVVCHEHVGDAARRWSPDEESDAGSLADCAARALHASERARAEKGLRRAYDQLAHVTWRMEAAKEDERRHIARELHDELGQSLTAIKLNLKLIAPALDGDAAATARLEEAGAIVDGSIRAMRELSRAMRPPLLDEVGLVPALQGFVDEQARRSPLEFRLTAPPGMARRTPELDIAAFRIVQEAVTNVLRHADARSVSIDLDATGDSLGLVVRDDGRGFDVDEVLGRIEDGSHLGLVGMRERARALGGRFDVSSTPGRGTEIRVVLRIGRVGPEGPQGQAGGVA